MSARPEGPLDYPLGDQPPDRFEALVFLLARATDPRVVPVRAPDQGLDARLPNPRGGTLRGWQAKRYTSQINWGECRESVRRALAFWRPPRITFCFPRDLSAAEQESFRTALADHFPEARIDFWPGSELQRLIRDTDEGRRAAAWLFKNPEADREEMLRAMAVGGELADSRQALARQAVIQEYMDRDPHLTYTLISRNPDGPLTPPAEQSLVSVTLVINGREVRADAAARYPGALQDAGAVPQVVFSDDEAGRRARETVERLGREGGRAIIATGVGAKMESIPVGLRGLMPEEGLWGAVEVIAEETRPAAAEFRQPVIVRAGGTELGMVLTMGEPPEGWHAMLRAAAGGLEVFYFQRGESDNLESRLDWRYTLGEGSGIEQLLATRIMLAAGRGELIELVDPDSGGVLISGKADGIDDPEEWQQDLEPREKFLGYVAELEAWLGQHLMPPAPPSEEDVKALSEIIPMIRQPEASITWKHVAMAPGAIAPEDDGPFAFALLQPLHARLFAEEVYLGMQLLHFPEGRVVDEGENLAIVPVSETGEGTSRLSHPDEVPPEAAQPPA